MAVRQPHPQALSIIAKGAGRVIRLTEDEIAAAIRAYYRYAQCRRRGRRGRTRGPVEGEGSHARPPGRGGAVWRKHRPTDVRDRAGRRYAAGMTRRGNTQNVANLATAAFAQHRAVLRN